MVEIFEALLASTLAAAPALVFGAMAAMIGERSGVISVHIEGMMRAGALAAAMSALVMPTPLAVLMGMIAGALVAALHAVLSIHARANQVVSGIALNLVALAAGTFLLESLFGPTGTPPIDPLDRWRLGFLEGIPLLRAFSGHTALTWLSLLLPFGMFVLVFRTPLGLRIRAVGEKPQAAGTLGVRVNLLRFGCLLGGGLLAGLGGAALSTTILDRFEQHMPAGLGFMALAAMVFGRWHPIGAAAAAFFFASGNALRIGLVSSAPWLLAYVPQGVLMALPYMLTLLVLLLQGRRTHAPAALGVPYEQESR